MKHPLKPVPFDQALRISKGRFVHDCQELAEALKELSDAEFKALMGKGHNNITSWILDHFQDKVLVSKLKGVRNPKRYAAIIEKRIGKFERVAKKRPFGIVHALLVILLLALLLQILSTMKLEDKRLGEFREMNLDLIEREAEIGLLENRLNGLIEENRILIEDSQKEPIIDPRQDIVAPKGRIAEGKIRVSGGGVFISVGGSSLTTFTDTRSMLPVLGYDLHGIEIVPASSQEIVVGDIISYESADGVIVHRVIETGKDENGWYAVVQGDNNPFPDRETVRFDQIKGVLVAVIY